MFVNQLMFVNQYAASGVEYNIYSVLWCQCLSFIWQWISGSCARVRTQLYRNDVESVGTLLNGTLKHRNFTGK